MNRLEWINNGLHWRSGPDTTHPIRGPAERGQINIEEYPGFKEFLGVYAEELDHGMFKLYSFDFIDPIYPLFLDYRSTIAPSIVATMRIDISTGEKSISYTTCEHCDTITFDKEHDEADYFAACKNIREVHARVAKLEAENSELRAEIAALRAENTELRYRPGGPGYYESAEHFAELALQ